MPQIGLLQATALNKAVMAQLLIEVNAGGEANMGDGFDVAYDVLKNGGGSACARAVLLFSNGYDDGIRKLGSSYRTDILGKISSLWTETPSAIFTYSLGP